ncbi:hypothetical protein ES706_02705 [subsurface metagenome]
MVAEAWQRAEIPGPIKALVIKKPEVVQAMIKKAKRPIFVVGHEAAKINLGDKKPIDYVIRIAKAANIPVVATAQTVAEFLKRDFRPAAWMSAMDIGNRLTDPGWSVSGEGGSHDLALFLGIPYYMEWVIESGLKSFAFHHLKTVSLNRFYQPHCNWSFSNISIEDWDRNLEIIAKGLEKK